MIWFVLALCLLVIAALVLRPFLKPINTADQAYDDWSRASLKAALAAVDKDESRGILTEDAANIQRADIARKAKDLGLDDDKSSQAPSSQRSSGRGGFIIAATALILAPCFLFGTYKLLGTDNPGAAQQAALKAQRLQPQLSSLDAAILSIKAQIEADPENARLWAALSDLKIRSQDLSGAEAALETAVNLPTANDKEKAQLWLMLAMTRRSQGLPLSDGSIIEPLEKSLAFDPASPAARLLERARSEGAEAE